MYLTRLPQVYSAFTVIVTVGYTAFDTYSKSSAGFFDKNKARTTDAGSFEVTDAAHQ